MSVVILRYNAGNVRSVANALARLGVSAEVSGDPQAIRKADRVIFPGVGAAAPAMRYLRERSLDGLLSSLTQPVLGICLGLQLLCARSEEGGAECLGVFGPEVRRFPAGQKVPHMGWSRLTGLAGPLFRGIDEGSYVYFVHGYRAELCADTAAVCQYGGDFSAALARDNFFAVQFHPEKSGETGAAILRNFLEI